MLIYISPYYSIGDPSAASNGVASFRFYDRYGGSQATALSLRAYEPVSEVGAAKIARQPYTWADNVFSEVGASFQWQEGSSFALTAKIARSPVKKFYTHVEVDTSAYRATFEPASGLNQPAAEANSRMWYFGADGDQAHATLSPGWVEGAGLLAGEADSFMWYYDTDGDAATATTVLAAPPVGDAKEPCAMTWVLVDGDLATATLSPSWVPGKGLLADGVLSTSYVAESESDDSGNSVQHVDVLSSVVQPPVYGNRLESRDDYFASTASNVSSFSFDTDATDGLLYFEVAALWQGGSAGSGSGMTCGFRSDTTTYRVGIPTDTSQYRNYGVLLDIDKKKMYILSNGSVQYSVDVYGSPGCKWAITGSIHGGNTIITGRIQFKRSKWSYVPEFAKYEPRPAMLIDGTAVGLRDMVLEEDETVQVLDALYLGLPPSTVIDSVKGNVLEGALLNTGSLLFVAPANSYTPAWCNRAGSTEPQYFELEVLSISRIQIGFTWGTGAPTSGETWNSIYGPYPTGGYNFSGVSPTTSPSYKDYVSSPLVNNVEEPVGTVLSALLLLSQSCIIFFRNGVEYARITNIPSGKTWKPVLGVFEYSTSANVAVRFNVDSWKYLGLPKQFGVVSTGGSSTGVMEPIQVEPSENQVQSTAVAVYQGQVPSTAIAPLKTSNPFEGAVSQNTTLTTSVLTYGSTAFLRATKGFDPAYGLGVAFYELAISNANADSFCCFGFTTNPAATDVAQVDAVAYSFYSGTAAVTNPNAKDFTINVSFGVVPYVLGAAVDTVNGVMYFYRNNNNNNGLTLIGTLTGLPKNKVWYPVAKQFILGTLTFKLNVSSWSWFDQTGFQLPASSPGGTYVGTAGIPDLNVVEDEVSSVPTSVPTGLVPSTVYSPAKSRNPLLGAVLAIWGNTMNMSGQPWATDYGPPVTTNAYFELAFSSPFQAAVYAGFTCGGGLVNNSIYWYTAASNNQYDYTRVVSMSTSGRIGVYLNVDRQQVEIWSRTTSPDYVIPIPAGKVWKPQITLQNGNSGNVYVIFNSFLLADAIGVRYDGDAPAGPVNGLAADTLLITDAESEARNITLANAALVTQLMNALPGVLVSDDTVWGSSRKLWTAELANLVRQSAKTEQDAITLVARLVDGQSPTIDNVTESETGAVTRTGSPELVTLSDIFKSAARGFKLSTYEYQACVDLATAIYWDYRNEVNLWPLNVRTASGLDNMTSITTEG